MSRRAALQSRGGHRAALSAASIATTSTRTCGRSPTTRSSSRSSKCSPRYRWRRSSVYGGNEILRSTLTVGAIAAFLQYARRFFRPIRTCPRNTTCCRARWPRRNASSNCSTHRSRSESPQPAHDRRSAGEPVCAGEVEFRDVWFAYRTVSGATEPRPAMTGTGCSRV